MRNVEYREAQSALAVAVDLSVVEALATKVSVERCNPQSELILPKW